MQNILIFVKIWIEQCSTSTFHATCPNAHIEEIRKSNTHNSFMITELLPIRSMILPISGGRMGGLVEHYKK